MFIVTARSEEGGVMMDDLDSLQMELETLLNCVVLRSLNLQREIAGMTEKVFIEVFFILCLLSVC